MNLFLAELSQAVAPGPHGIVLDGQGRLANCRRAARARKPQSGVPATLLARAQPDRAAMAASARQSPVPPRLSNDRGDHDSCCEDLELALAETGRIRSLC